MQDVPLTCTDLYVSVCAEINREEFVITEWKKGMSLLLKKVFQNQQRSIYHCAPYFTVEFDDDYLSFCCDFDLGGETWNFTLHDEDNDFGHTYVSDEFAQFAPKEGAVTVSSRGSFKSTQIFATQLPEDDWGEAEKTYSALIELHFYRTYDEV